ncbi:hypothetical protein CK203_116330 [Vitis vinifera]|uniref:Uncharacterized protein n=1 Tax=Vitis vinifera TaxID=29760 RepID=A0A438CT53_VITVI|nr:hypothetical protein CK203_116330 [Vitis vinifera]
MISFRQRRLDHKCEVKDSSDASLFGKGQYKFWVLAAILLLTFWSMFTGTVTLRWSASNLNHISDDFDSHIHDDLDVLEMEEREGGEAHVGCVHQQPTGKIAEILAGGIRGCV